MIWRATTADARTLAELAAQMWDTHEVDELTAEYKALLSGDEAACFLLKPDGESVGFAQCQLRHDYVEGTQSSPVGYLEGIYVQPEYRRRGYATALLHACEQWAKEKGCTEFASDCELGNDDSLRFHLAAGFTEANRVICFRKEISHNKDRFA